MNSRLYILSLFVLIASCNQSETEKKYSKWKPATKMGNQIETIHTPFILGKPTFKVLNNTFIINELRPYNDKAIHFFQADSFTYIGSTGKTGRGPGELGRAGNLATNAQTGHFWLSDFSKYILWKFNLDSALTSPNYMPVAQPMSKEHFMVRMAFVNDTLAMGNVLAPISPSNYEMKVAFLNTKNNKIEVLNHPVPGYITEKRTNSFIALSRRRKLYARAYIEYDLLTIRKFNGELICNIKGPGWSKTHQPVKKYYSHVAIVGDYIIAAYLGEDGLALDETKRTVSVSPTKLLIFDLKGNHLKTIDTQNPINNFTVDKKNGRIILCFTNREKPLGYLNLNTIY